MQLTLHLFNNYLFSEETAALNILGLSRQVCSSRGRDPNVSGLEGRPAEKTTARSLIRASQTRYANRRIEAVEIILPKEDRLLIKAIFNV